MLGVSNLQECLTAVLDVYINIHYKQPFVSENPLILVSIILLYALTKSNRYYYYQTKRTIFSHILKGTFVCFSGLPVCESGSAGYRWHLSAYF